MTAWLAAQSDYTTTNHPKLIAVPLNNSVNVLGPLQFDNNINTDPIISPEISLLSQHGSSVILGNVIVLPFNNDSFLYVRPLYVLASGGAGGTAFPQLHEVIVGTQNASPRVRPSPGSADPVQHHAADPGPGQPGTTTPTTTTGPQPPSTPPRRPTSRARSWPCSTTSSPTNRRPRPPCRRATSPPSARTRTSSRRTPPSCRRCSSRAPPRHHPQAPRQPRPPPPYRLRRTPERGAGCIG